MVLETIYIVRHGFRMSWSVDPYTVKYHTHIPTPTGLPADPALSSYGESQATQLGLHVARGLDPSVDQVISSPYYRCLQTLRPGVLRLQEERRYKGGVLLESGFEEWYGETGDSREQPAPCAYEKLKSEFFGNMGLCWDEGGRGAVIRPNECGESIEMLHERVAYALLRTIERADREGWRSVLICTHAAVMIAVGRVLTGRMPEDVEEEDFHCFTASLSMYRRKNVGSAVQEDMGVWDAREPRRIPQVTWRGGEGVMGSWECLFNGNADYLENGQERGWHFSGDESFMRNPENVVENVLGHEKDKEDLNLNRALCVAVAQAEEDDDDKPKSRL